MSWFGSKDEQSNKRSGSSHAVGNPFDPHELLDGLTRSVPRYVDDVDNARLVLPACTRTSSDQACDIRSIWDHTRLEAIRYLMMVPGRDFSLLTSADRQGEMLDVFLRQRPHENTVVEFTGVTATDFAIAIIAGFNWLNSCALLTRAPPDQFSRSLRTFRKVAELAQQWWMIDGAAQRCSDMLTRRERPPLMIYLIWSDYTRLAKEIASAAIFGSPADHTEKEQRHYFSQTLAGPSAEPGKTVAMFTVSADRLRRAQDPEDLSA